MGCFQSVPGESPQRKDELKIPTKVDLPDKKDVVSVPRAKITVDDRDRAELKLKNLRDRLQQLIMKTEAVLKEEGKLALKLKREGKPASAVALLRRRKKLRERIEVADAQLDKVSDNIQALETARDNKNLIDALNQGTEALNEINKQLDPESVQAALDGHRDAVDYVNNIAGVYAADANLNEEGEDLDTLMNELAEEYGFDVASQSGATEAATTDPTAVIPNVPIDKPAPIAPESITEHAVDDAKDNIGTLAAV